MFFRIWISASWENFKPCSDITTLTSKCMSRCDSGWRLIIQWIWSSVCYACNQTTEGGTIPRLRTRLASSWWETVTTAVSPIVTLSSSAVTDVYSAFRLCTPHTLRFITCYFSLMGDRGGLPQYRSGDLNTMRTKGSLMTMRMLSVGGVDQNGSPRCSTIHTCCIPVLLASTCFCLDACCSNTLWMRGLAWSRIACSILLTTKAICGASCTPESWMQSTTVTTTLGKLVAR